MSEFDEKAATWDKNPERLERAKLFAEEIRNNIDLDRIEMAMEYGCGTGLLSFQLRDDLEDVTLMDESAAMIQATNDKCERRDIRHFHPIQYNLLEEELPEQKFDLIFTMMTMHHVKDTDKILDIFQKLLNPKGYLVLIDLETEDGSFHESDFDGHLGFDQDELEEKVEKSGLEVISFHVGDTIETERNGEPKEFPIFILIARKN